MRIAEDTETTGLDLHHGCRPFLVSILEERSTQKYISHSFEWRVDPFTRTCLPEAEDIAQIEDLHRRATEAIYQNSKFDLWACQLTGIKLPDLKLVQDCIIASHCLHSGTPHGLKLNALVHADMLDQDEQELKKACVSARRIGKQLGWRTAAPGDPHWPTVKSVATSKEESSWWHADMWMPRECYLREEAREIADIPEGWKDVCKRYCIRDTERTMALWLIFEEMLEAEGLRPQYEVRRRMIPAVFKMEGNRVSINTTKLRPVKEKHLENRDRLEAECYSLVNHKIDNLESPKQLQAALYTILGLPILKRTKKAENPSTDKEVLDLLMDDCTAESKAGKFLRSLRGYRKRSGAYDSVESYERGSFPHPKLYDYAYLCPSFNITGTNTTRLSSTNPNGQNIAEGKEFSDHPEEGFNLRELFGPIPGRVWYSIDYSNIELRIFSYEAGEREFIDAFEAGYAVHLLVARELYPKEFIRCEKLGLDFKKEHPDLYQWVKNGNFSLIYGAGIKKADSTYHMPGAYNKIRRRFHHIDSFMKFQHNQAKTYGHITCLGGYRLQVPADGPHKAVNYFVQGSAGWAICLAMGRIDDYLDKCGSEYKMLLTVHDELVFDFVIDKWNLERVQTIAGLMEKSGDDLGLPLPVEASIIRDNWGSEKPLDLKRRVFRPVAAV